MSEWITFFAQLLRMYCWSGNLNIRREVLEGKHACLKALRIVSSLLSSLIPLECAIDSRKYTHYRFIVVSIESRSSINSSIRKDLQALNITPVTDDVRGVRQQERNTSRSSTGVCSSSITACQGTELCEFTTSFHHSIVPFRNSLCPAGVRLGNVVLNLLPT